MADGIFISTRTELLRFTTSRMAKLRCSIRKRIPKSLQTTCSEDDILQEVLLTACLRGGKVKFDNELLAEAWLNCVVSTALGMQIRYANAAKRGANCVANTADLQLQTSSSGTGGWKDVKIRTPSRVVHFAHAGRMVQDAIDMLEPAQQRVVRMHFLEGLSRDEIAAKTGKSKSAIGGLLYRGMRKLEEHLGTASQYLSGDSRNRQS